MDVKQLKTFITVAQSGSLSAASDRLRLAQPALSRHIKLLEEEVGVALFIRHGRGMHPTEAGAELLRRVSGLVLQLDRAIEDLDQTAAPRGQVALGLFPTVIPMLGARIVRAAAQNLPGVALRVVEAFPQTLIDQLQTGELDVALLIGPSADLHLRTSDLLYEPYAVIGAKNAGLSAERALSLRELSKLPLILPGPVLRSGNPAVAAAERAGVKLQIKYEIDSSMLTFDMVEAGLGYTIAPLSAIKQKRDKARFSTSPLEKGQMQRQLILALPTSRVNTRATNAIADLIVDEIAELVDRGTWDAIPDVGLRLALERRRSARVKEN